ncbi:hypothetical protein DXG01_003437 [Tephrocybe rancida]|nr:hypothetical protein DXG01_003437 [Tephrocybe rancida]
MSQFNSPPPAPMSTDVEIVAVNALGGLWMASQHGNPHLPNPLDSGWKNLWKWLPALYRKLIIKEYSTVHLAVQSIQSTMSYFLGNPSTASAVATTPGVLGLAVEMYIDLARHPSVDDMEIDTRGQRTCLVLQMILSSPLSNFQEVIETVGSGQHHVTRKLLQPVYLSVNGGKAWMRLFGLIFTIHITLLKRNPEFYHTIHTRTLMSTVCDSLSKITGDGIPIHDPTEREGKPFGIKANLSAIVIFWHQYSSQVARGYSWVIYALEKGILLLTFKLVNDPRLRYETSIYLTRIMNDLKLHALHRPVLRCLKRDPTLHQSLYTKDSTICEMWKLLQDAVRYSDAAHKEFEALKLPVPGLNCAYPLCFKDKTMKVWRCTGCKVVFYCSVVCQGNDWRRHRRAVAFIVQPRTLAFFDFLVEREMDLQRQTIQALRDNFLSNRTTPPPYLLVIDYIRQTPPEVTIEMLHEEQDLNEFGKHRIPILLPYICVPYGTEERQIFICPLISGQLFGWFN